MARGEVKGLAVSCPAIASTAARARSDIGETPAWFMKMYCRVIG